MTDELNCMHVLLRLCQYKIFQYLWIVATGDTETQRNGIVVVMWGIGEGIPSPDPSDLTS
jgi:hypothetical protein